MAAKAQLLVEAVDMTRTAMQSVDRNLASVQAAADRVSQSFQAVVMATGALTFGRAMVENAMQAEQASNRLDAVLKATGKSAGIAKDELDAMADALAGMTQFDDESIRAAEATLLKFGNVGGDVFREGLKLATDYAAFMGTDVADAAQTVGKALSSPTEGLMALERQIGKISPEQDRLIKQFMEQGRVAEAQGVVLDILRGKIGGTAEIMNTGLTGATSGVKKAWDELLETMGKTDAIGGRAERGLRGMQYVLQDIRRELEGKSTPLSGLMDDFLKVAMQAGPMPVRLAAGAMVMGKATGSDGDLNSARMQGVYGDAYGGSNVTVAPPVRFSKTKEQMELEAKAAKERDALLKKNLEGAERAADESFKAAEQRYIDQGQRDKKALEERKRLYAEAEKSDFEAWEKSQLAREEELNAIALARARAAKAENQARDADMAEQMARQQKAIETEAKKGQEAARDMGIIFVSAAEESIRKWQGFGNLVKNIALDVANMAFRKSVTEPLAGAATSFFGNLFGGSSNQPDISAAALMPESTTSFATGGSFMVGGSGGTDSQRVSFNASPDERVTIETPAQQRKAGGGLVVNQSIHVGGNVTQADLLAAMRAAKQGAIEGVAEMAKREPRYRAALQSA